MFQDTVLVGGAGFLIAGGVIWLILQKISNSSVTDRTKRMLTYLMVGLLIAVAIFVIDWHSQNYKAKHALLDEPAVISQSISA